MRAYLYRLHFEGPVHFGDAGISMENARLTLGSDSLMSALVNAFALLGDADETVKALISESPPFTLSSLFPYGPSPSGKEILYALPRPLAPPPLGDPEVMRDMGKAVKRLAYLDPKGFSEWIGNAPISWERLSQILERAKPLANMWDPVSQFGWHSKELRPRVSLDRTSSGSSLWHCGSVRFQKEAGLYGFVRASGEGWLEKLEAAYRLLGELGLGGERTYGMGSFRLSSFEPINSVMPDLSMDTGGMHVLLSNYFPSQDERKNFQGLMEAWDFFESRGYVVSGRYATKLKRKSLRMVVCGSVAKRPLKGAMVDVTPDRAAELGLEHRVYRSGLAFTMPEGGRA